MIRREEREERAFLTLEQVTCPQRVLPGSIEFHIPLNGLERIAREEFSDNFRIIDAARFGRRLLEHLPHAESLRHIRTDAISTATILRPVVADHLAVLVGDYGRIPT